MRIVNVDDDSDDSEMFVAAVAQIDPSIQCISVESGIRLLEFLETTDELPDFIFMDFNMPKLNGYESAQAIRTNKAWDPIEIVIHSTAFSPSDATKFAALRCKSLVKQSTFEALVQSVKSLIA